MTAAQSEAEREEALDAVAAALVEQLRAAGMLRADTGPFPAPCFHRLRTHVQRAFSVPRTAITTIMSRLLFGIAAAQRPRVVLGLGTFVGNALVWLCGPALEAGGRLFAAEQMTGCDVDSEATRCARANFDGLPGGSTVRLVHGDAREVVAEAGSIDLLYLDTDSDTEGKQLYAPLLEAARPRLAPGAVVVAHDAVLPRFQRDLAPYRALVADRARFRATVTLAVDRCGLEVTAV